MTTECTTLGRPKLTHGRIIVLLIAIFKLFKALLLILAAAAAVALTRSSFSEGLRQWINDLAVGPYRQRVGDFVLNSVLGLKLRTLYALAAGASLYATLFLTEGVGLLFDKLWAEWLAVISTAGLIPLEVLEIIRRRDETRSLVLGLLTFAANVAIVIYLYFRARARMRDNKPHLAAMPT